MTVISWKKSMQNFNFYVNKKDFSIQNCINYYTIFMTSFQLCSIIKVYPLINQNLLKIYSTQNNVLDLV